MSVFDGLILLFLGGCAGVGAILLSVLVAESVGEYLYRKRKR